MIKILILAQAFFGRKMALKKSNYQKERENSTGAKSYFTTSVVSYFFKYKPLSY
jgi:hypothetical protein